MTQSICGQEGTIEDDSDRTFCGKSHMEHQAYLDKVEEERKKRDAEQVELLRKSLEESAKDAADRAA